MYFHRLLLSNLNRMLKLALISFNLKFKKCLTINHRVVFSEIVQQKVDFSEVLDGRF